MWFYVFIANYLVSLLLQFSFFFFPHFSSYGVSPSTCLVMHESNMWKFGNASSSGFA